MSKQTQLKDLTAKGKLIEAGFIGLRAMALPADAPAAQIEDMRNAFFAGANHLFSSIMTVLDPGAEPTDADMKRMDQIDKELREFIDDFQKRYIPTRGNA